VVPDAALNKENIWTLSWKYPHNVIISCLSILPHLLGWCHFPCCSSSP